MLAVFFPDLLSNGELEREARIFARVPEALQKVSPDVDVVRQGLCALATGGPSRYFGEDDPALAERVRRALDVLPSTGRIQIGIADGLFAACLAARLGTIVEPGSTEGFFSRIPIAVLGHPEMTQLLPRLGIRTLADFAVLPEESVLARFGRQGAACHRACRGLADLPPGVRVAGNAPPRSHRSEQQGFWGGISHADLRAASTVVAVQEIAGPESVFVARLGGGRDPQEICRFVLWGKGKEPTGEAGWEAGWEPTGEPGWEAGWEPTGEPGWEAGWEPTGEPGWEAGWEAGWEPTGEPASRSGDARRLRCSGAPTEALVPRWASAIPSPPPALVHERARLAQLVDVAGRDVAVDAYGLLSARPHRLSVERGPWAELTGWAGPWREYDLWWSSRKIRRARLQVTTPVGEHLIARTGGRWLVEATYD